MGPATLHCAQLWDFFFFCCHWRSLVFARTFRTFPRHFYQHSDTFQALSSRYAAHEHFPSHFPSFRTNMSTRNCVKPLQQLSSRMSGFRLSTSFCDDSPMHCSGGRVGFLSWTSAVHLWTAAIVLFYKSPTPSSCLSLRINAHTHHASLMFSCS